MPLTLAKKSQFHDLICGDHITVSDRETAGSTLQILRERKRDFRDQLGYIYVVDEEEKLTGILRIRDLLVQDPAMPIAAVMRRSVVFLTEHDSWEKMLKTFRTYSFFALPVTDSSRRLLGVIRAKDVQRFLGSTIRRHFYQFADFSHEEVEGKGVGEIVLKRLPWLLISVTSGLVCAYLLGMFIGRIESIVAFILFVPIVVGLSGSAGTQSASIVLRGMDEGKLSISKLISVLAKEISVGTVIGAIACLAASLIALVWRKFPSDGIALGASIAVGMAVSGALGMILPIVFKILRIRSSFASGLFLLLICDMVSLALYFVISLYLVNPMIELG